MDALDHLQNDSVLQPDAAEAEVPASNQNSTLNSTLSESFVKMLDDPSLVADDLEENILVFFFDENRSSIFLLAQFRSCIFFLTKFVIDFCIG